MGFERDQATLIMFTLLLLGRSPKARITKLKEDQN